MSDAKTPHLNVVDPVAAFFHITIEAAANEDENETGHGHDGKGQQDDQRMGNGKGGMHLRDREADYG